jgi:hypothetical protein
LGENRCLYLILSVVLAARNSKHLSWGAASRNARSAKAEICKSRCLFLRIGAVAILPHQGVRTAVQVVPAVPVPAAVHVIKQALSASRFLTVSLKKQRAK